MRELRADFVQWVGCRDEHNRRILCHLFRKKDIEGRCILDIGAGNGEAIGFFISEFGAADGTAVDLYSETGSGTVAYEKIHSLQTILGTRLNIVKCDIRNYSPMQKYGFIFAISSMHHIYKSKSTLKNDPKLEKRTIEFFKRVGNWLEDDGKFVFFELARRNWSLIPKYWRYRKRIEFKTKQDPWSWATALKKAGFKRVHVKYPSPFIFDKIKIFQQLFNNYLMCILTGSGYLVEASHFRDRESSLG